MTATSEHTTKPPRALPEHGETGTETPDVVIHPQPVWNEHWASLDIGMRGWQVVAVLGFIYTSAIITRGADALLSYDDRWCYHDQPAAIAAARAWLAGDDPEPSGWHRHPATGRRRPGGDPAREHINP